MVWYGMVWYGMVWYGMVWYGIVFSIVVLSAKSQAVQKSNQSWPEVRSRKWPKRQAQHAFGGGRVHVDVATRADTIEALQRTAYGPRALGLGPHVKDDVEGEEHLKQSWKQL